MALMKTGWGVVAVLALVWTSISLTSNLPSAQSAMQASQLYNEAAVNILGVVAVTLLLGLAVPSNRPTSDVQQQAQELAAQAKRIGDVLDRMEQFFASQSGLQAPNAPGIDAARTALLEHPEPVSRDGSPVTSSMHENPCPICHGPMTIKIAAKGEHQGKRFYVCANFPTCQGIVPL